MKKRYKLGGTKQNKPGQKRLWNKCDRKDCHKAVSISVFKIH